MLVGSGCEGRCGAIVVCSRSLYTSILTSSRNGKLVNREFGSISSITLHHQCARVVGIAIAPTGEMVMLIGCCCQRGSSAVVVCAATGYIAFYVVIQNGYGIFIQQELGSVGSIALYRYRARVVGIAVAPLCKMVMLVGSGCEGRCGAIVVCSRSLYTSILTSSRNGKLVNREFGR